MPVFTIEAPDGRRLKIEADSPDLAMQGAQEYAKSVSGGKPDDFVAPAPPPGAMIHEAGRSYIAGEPGKAPDFAVAVPSGTSTEDRDMMSAALQGRADRGGLARRAMPAFQGLTAGFGDEVVSGLYAAGQAVQGNSPADSYNLAQEMQRQELEQNRAERPIESAVGQIGGAVLQAPAIAAAGLPTIANMSLAGRAVTGVVGGGAYGAVEGFGSGSGFDDRMDKARTGAAIGAVAGAALPVVGEVARRGANAVLDSRTVNRSLNAIGLNRGSGDALMRALDADDAFSGQGARNVANAGPDAMLVDAGPTARGVLDTAMQRGGPATRTARQAVNERARTAYQNLTSTMDRTLGVPEGVETATAAIREGTRDARRDAYEAAYNAAIDYSAPRARQLENLLSRVPGDVVARANRLMQLDGEQSRHILANIADDGSVTFQQMPDVRQIDYITRGLRQAAESGEGQGALGGQTQLGSAYERLAGTIRRTTRDLVPEYGQALDTAADPISRIAAMRVGRDMLNPNTPRDVVARQVGDMGQAEIAAARQGIRSQIDEVLANVRAVASDPELEPREAMQALKMLSSRAAREKIRLVLPDREAHQLFSELGRASRALELYAGVSRNSATFARTATNEAVEAANDPGAWGLLMQGKPMQAGKRVVQEITGRTPADQVARNDETYRQLAVALTARRGPDAQRAMQQLTDAYQAGPVNRARAEAIGVDLGAGTALGLHQLGQQYLRLPQR